MAWRSLRAAAFASVALALVAACTETSRKRARPLPKGAVRWKAVLMTGDDSIVAFDNARKRLRTLLVENGVRAGDIRELSMTAAEQTGGVGAASAANLERALRSLAVGKGDGCLVHLTSHGHPTGFYMRGQSSLEPDALDGMLTRHCGDRPTVVFVSACYSGVFTQNVLRRKNRMLFSAARDDRSSFGCGVEDVYTFWDGCLLHNLTRARTWSNLRARLDACIRAKERDSGLRFSYPQAWIGTGPARLPVLDGWEDGP